MNGREQSSIDVFEQQVLNNIRRCGYEDGHAAGKITGEWDGAVKGFAAGMVVMLLITAVGYLAASLLS